MTYYTQIMLMPLKGGALLHIVSNQEYTEYKGDWNMQSIETYGEDYNPRAPEAKYCQYFWLPNSEMPEEYTLMDRAVRQISHSDWPIWAIRSIDETTS